MKSTKNSKNWLLYILILFSSSVPIFIWGYLGNMTRFIADDYCSVYFAKELGFYGSIYHWYTTLGGGYSAFGTDWLVLSLFDAYHIRLIPPLILIVWVISTILATSTIFKSPEKNTNLLKVLASGTTIVFFVLVLSPNIRQSLFWWGGMRAYTLPLVILTFAIFTFNILVKKALNNWQFILTTLFILIFAFANGGFSSAYVVMQLALSLFFILLRLLELKKSKKGTQFIFLLAAAVGSALSLAVNLRSYGNVIRRSIMPSAPDIPTLLSISWDSYLIFIQDTFLAIEKPLAILGVLLLAIWIGKEHGHTTNIPLWKVVLYFLGGLLSLFGSFLPGVYGYAAFPPTRSLIIGVFTFSILSLCASFLLGGWLQQNKKNIIKGAGIALLGSILLLTSSIITSRSFYASRDVYIEFAEKWDRVDAEILEAKAAGAPSITTEAMTNWAGLDRPNENPKWWPTECYSLYYDILVMGPPY